MIAARRPIALLTLACLTHLLLGCVTTSVDKGKLISRSNQLIESSCQGYGADGERKFSWALNYSTTSLEVTERSEADKADKVFTASVKALSARVDVYPAKPGYWAVQLNCREPACFKHRAETKTFAWMTPERFRVYCRGEDRAQLLQSLLECVLTDSNWDAPRCGMAAWHIQ